MSWKSVSTHYKTLLSKYNIVTALSYGNISGVKWKILSVDKIPPRKSYSVNKIACISDRTMFKIKYKCLRTKRVREIAVDYYSRFFVEEYIR